MLANHKEGPNHIELIVFSDIIVHFSELHHWCCIEHYTRSFYIELHPPEWFLNIDLSIERQNHSRLFEPFIFSGLLCFSMLLKNVNSKMNVMNCISNHSFEEFMKSCNMNKVIGFLWENWFEIPLLDWLADVEEQG